MTIPKKSSILREKMELFAYVFAALFSLINPLGTLPVFVGLTGDDSQSDRSKTALLTSIDAFVILMISFFVGNYMLEFFGISIESLRIAGGLIIASSGFALLTGTFSKHKGMHKERVKKDVKEREEVALTPLAIPMLAGPGAISLLIGMHEEYGMLTDKLIIIASLFTACLVVFVMLKSAHFIVKFLGASGMNAISRIIGFIVIAIGIEFVSTSVLTLLN